MKNKHIAYGIAENGQEAVDRWNTGNYHLVLVCAIPILVTSTHISQMDIQMPVMDGVTATQRIRALPNSCRDIPIIAMTGNVLPQQVRTFLEAGMNDHVGKPIERAKLYSSVRRWVSRSGGHDVNVALN